MGFFDFIFGKKKETASKPSQTVPSNHIAPHTKESSNMPKSILGKYFSLEQLQQVPMGQVRLQPIDARLALDSSSQQTVALMAQISPDIKQYLPNLDLSSANAIGKYFLRHQQMTELGYKFGYAIKMGDDGYMGFIFINTPAINEKAINFPNWTIDFCLFQPFQGQGIMLKSLSRALYILKSIMHVDNVYAYVDEDNSKCLNLLSNLPFDLQPEKLTDPATGKKALLFCCPLHQINFQRR